MRVELRFFQIVQKTIDYGLFIVMEKEFKVSRQWMRTKYEQFNTELFGGILPKIDFAVGSSTQHSGYARYVIYRQTQTIKPLKILLSSFLNPNEEIATNTLLHEMIHVCDYVTHPEHFLGEGYDSHKSDFFQSWLRELNDKGYWVTESAQNIEISAAKTVQAEKSKRQEAIAVIAFWNDQTYCDIFWTEEKYLPSIIAKNSGTYYTSFVLCKVNDNSILTMPECKGKATRRHYIAQLPPAQVRVRYANGEIELPGYKEIDTMSRILSKEEASTILRNTNGIRMSILSKLDKIIDDKTIERNTNKEGKLSVSSRFFDFVGNTEFCVAIKESLKKTEILQSRGLVLIYLPLEDGTVQKFKEIYAKRCNGEAYFGYDEIMREITDQIIKGLTKMQTAEKMLNENKKKNKLDMIVEETIKEFVDSTTAKKPQRVRKSIDKSVVDVKELGNGAEIITQW